MARRNREINIFNLSMLDVICGALGAFLILFLIAAPHYGNTSTQQAANPLAKQLLVLTTWEAAQADVNMWVYTPDKRWAGPKGARLFNKIEPAETITNEAGTDSSVFAFTERFRDTGHQLRGEYVVVAQLVRAPAGADSVEVRVTSVLEILEPPSDATAPMRSFKLRQGEAQVTAVIHVGDSGKSLIYRVGEAWTTPGTWPNQTSALLNRLEQKR